MALNIQDSSELQATGKRRLEPWTRAQVDAFMAAPMVFGHHLGETDLFADDRLAALLDRYPPDAIDINLYDYDAQGQVTLRTGVRGGLSGAALLDAVKAGRLWLNCKFIMDQAPDIAALVRALFEDIAAMRPDFRPRKIWGQLLISSPAAKVPYHADPSGVMLFHLRGRKRIYVYPADEAHAPTSAIEKIVAQQQTEELPYRRAMDANAAVFDLEPGQAIAWPFYAPHRVENLSSFCVSLSVDYLTRAQQVLNGVHFTNLALRRLGIQPPCAARLPAPMKTAFWIASGGLKKLGVMKEQLSAIPRDFVPAAHAKDGASPLSTPPAP